MEAKKSGDASIYKNGKGHITIAVIGERGCGKTALVLAASNQIFPHPDERIASKKFIADVEDFRTGKTHKCLVLEGDISLQDEPDVRSKWYLESDVVVLCFAEEAGSEDLKNVMKWDEKLRQQVPVQVVRIIKKPEKEGPFPFLEPKDFPIYRLCFPHDMKGVKKAFELALFQAIYFYKRVN